jgi:DNA replication protein DnaC
MTEKPNPSKLTPKQQLLQAQLAELRLTQIAELYPQVLDDAARKNNSAFDVLSALVGAEVAARRQRALQRRIHEARLPPRKTVEEFDFTFPKRIPKQKILRLCDCEFVTQRGCAVFIGPTGTGKTHFLTVLGYVACERQFTVRFTRVVDMLNELTTAHINGTLRKALRPDTRPDLLLLDELGYLPIDKRGADLMFQVVAARYERGSTVVTTNRIFREWGKIFDLDNTLATALIDRLMHHGEPVTIEGKSYRLKDQLPD